MFISWMKNKLKQVTGFITGINQKTNVTTVTIFVIDDIVYNKKRLHWMEDHSIEGRLLCDKNIHNKFQ